MRARQHGWAKLLSLKSTGARHREFIGCIALGLGIGPVQPVELPTHVSAVVQMPYTLRMTATTTCEAPAVVALSRQEEDGSSRLLLRGPLVNNPAWVWLDSERGWFATAGSACSDGADDGVVVYDGVGHVVRNVKLSDVLSQDEVRRIGETERSGAPRSLDEDERTGNDFARDRGRVYFTTDGVWLRHPRVSRAVLLVRR